MVSGSISLPLQGFFSPFPHGTAALSVAVEYLALDRGRPRFRQGSSCPALLRYRTMESDPFRLRGFHAVSRACYNNLVDVVFLAKNRLAVFLAYVCRCVGLLA